MNTKMVKNAETRRNLHTHTHTHTHTCNLLLSPKQIGTICFAISILFSAPSFADPDIPSSASSADCKHTPLQVYSGTSNLQAGWAPNTIQLHWYNGDTEIQNVPSESQSCVYDGTLTPPATIPTRTGYTFKGWRVRDLTCGLSHVDISIGRTWYASKGSTGYCYYYNDTGDEVDGDCSDSHFAGLNNSEWETNFSYGTVKGTSYCSGLSGDNNNWTWGGNSSDWSATESELTSASGEKKYCWCKMSSYTPSGGTACNVASPSWVFSRGYESASDCADYCADDCANIVFVYDGFRRAVFGVAGN